MNRLFSFKKRYAKNTGLMLTPLNLADAKETRNHGKSKPPPDRLAGVSISAPAENFYRAVGGNWRSELWIIKHLSNCISRHALIHNWKINKEKEKIESFAEICLWPYMCNDTLSDSNAAKMIGVAKSSYQKNWKPKIETIDRLIKVWAREAAVK